MRISATVFCGDYAAKMPKRILFVCRIRKFTQPMPGMAWAAKENRILLTHDINTVPNYAYERVRGGQPMPGVIAMPLDAPIGPVIEDLLIVIRASEPEDYEGQVVFLPL
jgi:hypothetical protein